MNNSMHPKRTRKKYYCVYCGKEVGRGGKYCSSLCKQNYEQDIYIQKWKNGEVSGLSGEYNISKRIRRYLMEKYDYKCCQCGWGERNPYTNLIPLEVDHIDGDHTNNLEDNLRLLCPNCH